jgi:uncharacterized protein YpmB
MSNGNGTAKWIAIIVTIFLAITGASFAYTHYTNKRIDRYEELLIRALECQAEMKADLRYIKKVLDKI